MTATADELRALAKLALHLAEAAYEREQAYPTRKTDPERWRAAKQRYADERRFWRALDGRRA